MRLVAFVRGRGWSARIRGRVDRFQAKENTKRRCQAPCHRNCAGCDDWCSDGTPRCRRDSAEIRCVGGSMKELELYPECLPFVEAQSVFATCGNSLRSCIRSWHETRSRTIGCAPRRNRFGISWRAGSARDFRRKLNGQRFVEREPGQAAGK